MTSEHIIVVLFSSALECPPECVETWQVVEAGLLVDVHQSRQRKDVSVVGLRGRGVV